MKLKELQEQIISTYSLIRKGEIPSLKGAEIIDSLFAQKRAAIALKAVPNPEKKKKNKRV